MWSRNFVNEDLAQGGGGCRAKNKPVIVKYKETLLYRRWFGQSTLFCLIFSEEILLRQLHSFRPSENWYSFNPLYVNLYFLDAAWRQLNTELRCTLWQNSNSDCRQLHQISNWCVHQNSLIRHTEKLIHSNLFFFVDWLIDWLTEPTAKYYFAYGILSLFCYVAYTANWKTGMEFGEIILPKIGWHRRKSLEALFYDIVSYCVENCARTT